jgi:predicted RNase H-like HicB family nuclease
MSRMVAAAGQTQRPRYDLGVKLKIVLEPSDEGGFTVFVPALSGCVSEGETREEALTNIREAIELYLEPSEAELSAIPGSKVEELVV